MFFKGILNESAPVFWPPPPEEDFNLDLLDLLDLVGEVFKESAVFSGAGASGLAGFGLGNFCLLTHIRVDAPKR